MKIGIDPGNTGAVAVLTMCDKLVEVFDMPTMLDGGRSKKQKVNAAALNDMLGKYPEVNVAYIEKVGAMPGQGVSSMFTFGMGFGVIQGVCAARGIPFFLVTPQAWKKRAGLIGKDKDFARTQAQQIFAGASLVRKKDVGRADALLIAYYGDKV